MPADVLIIIPVLRRPHRAAPVLQSALDATPGGRVLFVGSPGDEAEHEAVRAAGGELLVIPEPCQPGDYARKVNAAYRSSKEPLLFLAADDVDFHPSWFEAAAAKVEGRSEVIGTNDLGNRRVMAGVHSTHTLVTRRYCDNMGTIDERRKVLHEGYVHEFVDDEFIETAKSRNAFAFARDAIVEHLHPLWLKAEWDPVYLPHKERMRSGRYTYMQRRHLWQT